MKKIFLSCMITLLIVCLWRMFALAMDVTLAWDANSETDLAGYRLYWANTSQGQSKTQTTNKVEIPLAATGFNKAAPQWTVAGLANNQTIYFKATAYDTEGLESDFSNEVSAYKDTIAPAIPKNLRVTVTK